MTLLEALEIADSAKEHGRLNNHPKACIVLAEELRRLWAEWDKLCTEGLQVEENQIES